jgi:hypothetical protein
MTLQRSAWGVSLFCDDIRQEIAGKVSLIGIYGQDMVVHGEFPALYPKLCIYVAYYEVSNIFKDDLSLRAYLKTSEDEKLINTVDVSRKDVEEAAARSPQNSLADRDSERVNILRVPVVFSPFSIPSECVVKVRMHCGEAVTKLGILSIRRILSTDNIQFS